jgi:hypothetical protein
MGVIAADVPKHRLHALIVAPDAMARRLPGGEHLGVRCRS